MTFRHGQSAVVLVDEFDLSPFLNAASVSASMEPAEVTNFASGCDREYIKGLRDVTVALEGFYASSNSTGTSTAVADVIEAAFTGSSSVVVTVGLEDDTVGRRAHLVLGDHVAYDVDSPVDDAISISADIQGSQGYYGGRWLRGLSASTSTGSNAAVDSGLTNGGTTGGGVAHLHVTDITSTGSATFRIQHSTSGSTWATLLTFAASTIEQFQRSTVAGTVKEQVRATISAITADSVTAAVAFARYGPSKA